MNSPMAFEPPPTHATTTSGVPTPWSAELGARLLADHALELADHVGNGCGPMAEPRQ